MDRRIRQMAIGFLVLFAALAVNLHHIQVIAADDLYNNDANLRRQLIDEYNVKRGAIYAADGTTELAVSVPTGGELRFLRRYPQGDLYAHITGFYSIVSGRTELEDSYNDYLAGRAEELFPQRLVDQILGREQQGASIVTTVDPERSGWPKTRSPRPRRAEGRWPLSTLRRGRCGPWRPSPHMTPTRWRRTVRTRPGGRTTPWTRPHPTPSCCRTPTTSSTRRDPRSRWSPLRRAWRTGCRPTPSCPTHPSSRWRTPRQPPGELRGEPVSRWEPDHPGRGAGGVVQRGLRGAWDPAGRRGPGRAGRAVRLRRGHLLRHTLHRRPDLLPRRSRGRRELDSPSRTRPRRPSGSRTFAPTRFTWPWWPGPSPTAA